MIPISCINLEGGQVIMAGDPLQLPPISLSNHARHYQLVRSMLERYIETYKSMDDIVPVCTQNDTFSLGISFNLLFHFSWMKMALIHV